MADSGKGGEIRARPWGSAPPPPRKRGKVGVGVGVGAKPTVSQANDNVPPEWRCQAAAVRALRSHPDYGRRFLVAGDMNAGKRGPQAQAQAQATGMTPGEPDLRVYLDKGAVRLIEYKLAKGRLSPAQRDRHAAMARIGHRVEVVWAASEADCAAQTVKLVEDWLAG